MLIMALPLERDDITFKPPRGSSIAAGHCPGPPNFAPQQFFPNSLQAFLLECNPRVLLRTPWNATMTTNPPQISLPKSWTSYVRSAILHVISLAQFATAYTRSWAANSIGNVNEKP